MSINRHNYEEYFILYMDNELTSNERQLVEAFVQQHPDLKEELELLFQFKLQPDESVVFNTKDELLKNEAIATITVGNYDEWMPMYIDNELTSLQAKQVTGLLASHPALQYELNLLKKAVLQPEAILFTDKKTLYRKEEKVRRIVPIWWRVAAILLLAIGLTTLVIVRKNKPTIDSAIVNTQPSTPAVKKEQGQQNPAATLPNTAPPINVDYTIKDKGTATNNNTTKTENTNGNSSLQKKKETVSTIQQAVQPVMATNKQIDNNLPTPELLPANTNKTVQQAIASVDPVKENKISNNSLTNTTVTKDNIEPLAIITTAFVAEDGNSKKNKSRGIFRKIARTFEKRTNIDPTDDNGRLLVAGFAFNTK